MREVYILYGVSDGIDYVLGVYTDYVKARNAEVAGGNVGFSWTEVRKLTTDRSYVRELMLGEPSGQKMEEYA